MQNPSHDNPDVTIITATSPMTTPTHGGRAKCLQRLVRLDLPVPRTVALSFDTVHELAGGYRPDVSAVLAQFDPNALLCVRPSSEDPDWGGPGAVLNIGMNDARYVDLCDQIGKAAATEIYFRFVVNYATDVARLDAELFDDIDCGAGEDALDYDPGLDRHRNCERLWVYVDDGRR